MKNRILLLLTFLLLIFNTASHAYDYLRVLDPQGWGNGQGSIEEATFTVTPKGLYFEYNVYLTLSAKGLNFSSSTNLEAVFNFDLPENAIVNDLWLWVGEQISKAYILDRWTANNIYEGIVNRRRDPALLTKMGSKSYELRVYPMTINNPRKIKLTYLVPAQWTAKIVSAPLPVNLIQAAMNKPVNIKIISYNKNEWKNPRIIEMPQIEFAQFNDSISGCYQSALVPTSKLPSQLNIAYNSPMINGLYVNAYKNGNEGIYQLALLPSEILDASINKKVVLLFDYEANKSKNSAAELLEAAKFSLLHSLTARDSFNIFLLSGTQVIRASYQWLKADSASIVNAFTEIASGSLTGSGNISPLFADGINFIKENGNNGSMLLISNSDALGDYNQANSLIRYLSGLMDPVLPIHIADFCNTYKYYYFGGRYYYGNEYLYINIAHMTYSNYESFKTRPAETTPFMFLKDMLNGINGFMANMDLHTSLQNGFCYGRFTPGGYKQNLYLNSPLLQIGKFKGTFPFKVQLSGEYMNIPFSKDLCMENPFSADSMNKVVWAGNNISSLLGLPQSNEVISQILNECISNRILSDYTSFLALEPGDTINVCTDCEDTQGPVSVKPEEGMADTLMVQGYPNPFNAQVTLKVTLPHNANTRNVSCSIYNVLGELIKTFHVADMGESRVLTLTWNGYSDKGEMTASGVYFFVVNTPAGRQTLKLMMLK